MYKRHSNIDQVEARKQPHVYHKEKQAFLAITNINGEGKSSRCVWLEIEVGLKYVKTKLRMITIGLN